MKNLRLNDFNSALKLLNDILKDVRPLDINDVRSFIQKAEEAATMIQNQDVILLIGRSASGKSATIHFLAGSKIV